MNTKTEHHSVIIIGAGLSGLYAAWRLHQQQQDVLLLEARGRIGGRILSVNSGDKPGSAIDMGPAWLWPQLQPKLNDLLQELDLPLFRQFTAGDMLFESATSKIERYTGQSSHSESYRLVGGNQQLIKAIQSKLPETMTHLNTQVTSIQQNPLSIQAIRDGKPQSYTADHIVLALPPRIALQSIDFNPVLPEDILDVWKNIPTWMAVQSKIVFTYDRPFWRDQNLSGEVFSQIGPLSEIYDGSPADETFYALTSFVGLNAHQRKLIKSEQLIEMSLTQLQRLFGDESKNVQDIQIKDWSLDQFTASEMDLQTAVSHPQYPHNLPRSLWENKLILAGTEVARENGGYIEGALESSDEAVKLLSNTKVNSS